MLKQYLLFSGSEYYPSGGWSDFRGSFATTEEAKDYLLNYHKSDDWWDIVDTATLKVVSKNI